MPKQQYQLLCQWWFSNLEKKLENTAKRTILGPLRRELLSFWPGRIVPKIASYQPNRAANQVKIKFR